MKDSKDLNGLGGWLVLVGFGVVVSPIALGTFIYNNFVPIFSEGLWPTLTDPRSSLYNPFWEPLLLGEMTFNVIVFAISLWLIYLFFSKHYLFPIVFVGFMLANLIFVPLDAWAATLIFPDDPMFDAETTKNMVRVAVSSAIWIPYMLLSRRVSQTFRSSA